MKIVTTQPLKNLRGENLKKEDGILTLGEALGNILLDSKTGGKMKTFILAQRMVKEGVVDVDEADLSLIKQIVESSEAYGGSLVSGQILIILDKKEEVKEKK